ncbi:hypothetical protein ES319_D07G017900v1 [Gossypium barbadense]|uniref:Uncharacterized protein n=2 Tax=Gossypium TaxID=3633 RepID=A0A5J5QL16_GOSBA|nr:hypothetical protein ES319_D07G017900v1 [Gossypium barbadense]TYG59848.1 hypothetical protein ES288_D07G019600v1 [Gossypium darwinii]
MVSENKTNMASLIPLSDPSSNFSVSSQNPVLPNSDFVSATNNSSPIQNSPKNMSKFRIKIPRHLFIATKENPNPITEPLIDDTSKFIKNNSKIVDDPSVVGKDDESESSAVVLKVKSLPVIDTQSPPRATTVPLKKHKQKKRQFSVVLTREEIEEDIVAIEALAGGKRLRRPKIRDPPYNRTDRRRIDLLFPGVGN